MSGKGFTLMMLHHRDAEGQGNGGSPPFTRRLRSRLGPRRGQSQCEKNQAVKLDTS